MGHGQTVPHPNSLAAVEQCRLALLHYFQSVMLIFLYYISLSVVVTPQQVLYSDKSLSSTASIHKKLWEFCFLEGDSEINFHLYRS